MVSIIASFHTLAIMVSQLTVYRKIRSSFIILTSWATRRCSGRSSMMIIKLTSYYFNYRVLMVLPDCFNIISIPLDGLTSPLQHLFSCFAFLTFLDDEKLSCISPLQHHWNPFWGSYFTALTSLKPFSISYMMLAHLTLVPHCSNIISISFYGFTSPLQHPFNPLKVLPHRFNLISAIFAFLTWYRTILYLTTPTSFHSLSTVLPHHSNIISVPFGGFTWLLLHHSSHYCISFFFYTTLDHLVPRQSNIILILFN